MNTRAVITIHLYVTYCKVTLCNWPFFKHFEKTWREIYVSHNGRPLTTNVKFQIALKGDFATFLQPCRKLHDFDHLLQANSCLENTISVKFAVFS